MTRPTYAIAHGNAAVQAARIIAAVAADKRRRAEAYDLAAEWHDKQAADCENRVKNSFVYEISTRAAEAARHHRASAAGLRLAATNLRRAAVSEVSVQSSDMEEKV